MLRVPKNSCLFLYCDWLGWLRIIILALFRLKRSAILFSFLEVVLGSNQERCLEIRVVLGVRLPKMSQATAHYYSCKSAVPVIAVIGVIAVVAIVVVAVVAVVSVVPVIAVVK